MGEQNAEKEGTTWRYAMTREQHDGEDFYTIREVYTSADGALSWTEDAIAARGDTWLECADDLAKMGRALNSPVLDLTLDPPAWASPSTLRREQRLRPAVPATPQPTSTTDESAAAVAEGVGVDE